MKSTTLLVLLFGFFVAFAAAAPKGGRGGSSRGGGSRGGHNHDHVQIWNPGTWFPTDEHSEEKVPPPPEQRECDAFNNTCVEGKKYSDGRDIMLDWCAFNTHEWNPECSRYGYDGAVRCLDHGLGTCHIPMKEQEQCDNYNSTCVHDYQTYKNGWLAKFAVRRCEQHTCKWDRSCARFGYKSCCPPGSGEQCGDGYRFISAPPPDSSADDSASHAGP